MKKKGIHFDAKTEFRRSIRVLLNKSKRLDRVKFFCPFCESQSILITIKKNIAEAKCSTCSITEKIKTYIHYDIIDVYGDLLDILNIDQEIQKLESRILELNKESKYKLKKDNNNKALCYSKISEICRKKVISLELLLKDNSNIDPIDILERNTWKLNLEKYKSLEKIAEDNLEKEKLREIEIKINEKPQANRNAIKKETKKGDIFSDPKFLDF